MSALCSGSPKVQESLSLGAARVVWIIFPRVASSSVQQLILAAAQCLLAAVLVSGGAACPEQSGSGQPQLQL